MLRSWILCAFSISCTAAAFAGDPPPLALMDVFELEMAMDPQISPDGSQIVYVRRSFDLETDRSRNRLWWIDIETGTHRPLLGEENADSPLWSPDGKRLAFLRDGQIVVKHLDGAREELVVTHERERPRSIAWSPDGRHFAFLMNVPEEERKWATIPSAPKGAKWAEGATVIDRLVYRRDGGGYVEGGHTHLFVVPADGGAARKLTEGDFDHGGPPSWSKDGKTLFISANRNDGWEYETNESEVWAVTVEDGSMRAVTDRRGPDENPVVSPDGNWIAYTGHDESPLGYHQDHLYVSKRDGSERRALAVDLDRSIGGAKWSGTSDGLFVQLSDRGETRIVFIPIDGSDPRQVASGVGGTSLGRPYSSGSFSVSRSGVVAYTAGTAQRPSDVAIVGPGRGLHRTLTALNEDLLAHRTLARVEEITVPSSHDGRPIHGWIAYPPTFDPERKYPLILEIHGGPFANYGARFSAEVQLYAAAGNVVLYTNPRGSTSYGAEFANLIHHAYPGNDYDDLMSCVDAVIEKGFIDTGHLFVTGGSGGGVLTAWIVGKTERFRAAVVAKPVIHWASFVLTADFSNFFTKYWFPGMPWEIPEHYWARSPLSLVGNVTTPTMLLTGEEDYRTPMSETEQYYQALKLRRIDTAMVRIPGAGHGITARPSNLVRKVAYILGWFDKHSEVP